ncbi:asparaginase [Thermoflavifilum aggregans]|uniref:Asparaginase n=1 Tax=Thermoflavifilum aggregans TaxID=454188 RepID=A0A2M9CX86_9BACT|nr:N(4)-(beta-N-acetylglucosaminyl)-L-asparaginase [Thermoflavifilum aggregans]PJJ76500.1 asparaginase [Thermoflavifilum aggregans]
MTHRRDFIKWVTAGMFGMPLLRPRKYLGFSRKSSVKPLVVSTWDFGIQANEAAWEILKNGGRALDAVEAGVRVPEADPNIQTIGLGGLPDRDGHVTLDACIMDEHGNAGAVACLEHIVHAISVARKVMEKTPHVMLVGEGALQFALSQGFQKQNLLTPASEKAWKEWLKTSDYHPVINIENQLAPHPASRPGDQFNHDTIGMLAIDQQGNLSGACTTSGLAFKMHGRVGDSPIIGAGLFVDNEIGAATATGVGEANMRICGTHTVVELMRQGHEPEEACYLALERLVKKQPDYARSIQLAFLAVNKDGVVGAFALQKGFRYAVHTPDTPNKLLESKSFY